jgi:hypothetical protein
VVFSVIGIVCTCAESLPRPRHPYRGLRPKIDILFTTRAIPLSGGMYGKRGGRVQVQVPVSGGVYGRKRAIPFVSFADEMAKRYHAKKVIPYSGGVYG